jgi:hypothetical protein
MMPVLEEAKMAKSAYKGLILSRPNVVGLGVGYKVSDGRESDELSVVVMVRQKLPPVSLAPEDMIPQEVAGVRTDVIEVGELRPLDAYPLDAYPLDARPLDAGTQVSRTGRIRPAPGGVSIGHYRITAGTLGCAVRDQKTGARLILSNNHVLANRNEGEQGDPILQPGLADGGLPERDTIALLERFEPIHYNQEPPACSIASAYAAIGNRLARWLGSTHQVQVFQFRPFATNLIDAALARPILESDVLDEILDIGKVEGLTEAALGMQVSKSGRTTDFTSGTINILDATVTVNYGGDRSATFDHQIVSTPMSQGGDSGSLLVASESKQAVGLLYAGSGQATLFNPIQTVLNTMKVDLPDTAAKSLNGQRAGPANRRAVLEKAQAVKEAYQHVLLAKPNVVGVGIGPRVKNGQRTDEIGIVVMVERKLPETMLAPQDLIPDQIEGVPVDVVEVGKFEAY